MNGARLLGVAPVLLVKDVAAAAGYWRDVLGFHYSRIWGEPPSFCMPSRDGMLVMLKEAPEGHLVVPNWHISPQLWDAYFWVDDVDALFAELSSRGAHVDYNLHDTEYGVREFGIQDPDLHDIAFGQDLEL